METNSVMSRGDRNHAGYIGVEAKLHSERTVTKSVTSAEERLSPGPPTAERNSRQSKTQAIIDNLKTVLSLCFCNGSTIVMALQKLLRGRSNFVSKEYSLRIKK